MVWGTHIPGNLHIHVEKPPFVDHVPIGKPGVFHIYVSVYSRVLYNTCMVENIAFPILSQP